MKKILEDLHLENFTAEDYDSAVILWKEIEGVTLNESDSFDSISAFLLRNPCMSFIVRNNAGELIATILCGHNARAAHIYHLAVRHDYRNRGIGSRLVKASFEKLKEAGIPRCNIFVYSDNYIGNQFWMKSGWDDPVSWKVLQRKIEYQ